MASTERAVSGSPVRLERRFLANLAQARSRRYVSSDVSPRSGASSVPAASSTCGMMLHAAGNDARCERASQVTVHRPPKSPFAPRKQRYVAFRSAKAALLSRSERRFYGANSGQAEHGPAALTQGERIATLCLLCPAGRTLTRCRPASCLRRRGSPDFSPYEENCRQSGGSRSMGIPARAMRKARAGMPMLRPAGGKSRQAPFPLAAAGSRVLAPSA